MTACQDKLVLTHPALFTTLSSEGRPEACFVTGGQRAWHNGNFTGKGAGIDPACREYFSKTGPEGCWWKWISTVGWVVFYNFMDVPWTPQNSKSGSDQTERYNINRLSWKIGCILALECSFGVEKRAFKGILGDTIFNSNQKMHRIKPVIFMLCPHSKIIRLTYYDERNTIYVW